MPDVPAFELHGIAKRYGNTAALREISMRLEAGQVLALLGPNGSGKTTLLKILAGAIVPSLGSGTISGRDLLRERAFLRREVGLLASESYLYEDLTAHENVRFAATMAGDRLAAEDLRVALREVGLERRADDRVRAFSSGMRKRLSLARLLLLRPRLLLLDEPYNSLDASGCDLIDDLIARHRAGAGSVVMATHDAERALGLAESVAVLQRGALAFQGSVDGYRVRDAQYVG